MSKIISITPLKPCEGLPFCNCEIKTTDGIEQGLLHDSVIDAYDKQGLVIWEDDTNE